MPYPMPPLPLSYNLARMREWTDRAGVPFWTQPWARNTEPYRGRNVCQRCDTCAVCPTGAKYTPDFAFDQLLADGRIELVTRTLVRRLARGAGYRPDRRQRRPWTATRPTTRSSSARAPS